MIWAIWEPLLKLSPSLPTLAEKRPPEAIALTGLLLSGWPSPPAPLPAAGRAPRHRTRQQRRPMPTPKPSRLPGAAHPSQLFFVLFFFFFFFVFSEIFYLKNIVAVESSPLYKHSMPE